jgi:hypothetical protein
MPHATSATINSKAINPAIFARVAVVGRVILISLLRRLSHVNAGPVGAERVFVVDGT